MGYRLEEFGIGLFTDKVCYRYRSGVPKCISKTEKTRLDWENVKKGHNIRITIMLHLMGLSMSMPLKSK